MRGCMCGPFRSLAEQRFNSDSAHFGYERMKKNQSKFIMFGSSSWNIEHTGGPRSESQQAYSSALLTFLARFFFWWSECVGVGTTAYSRWVTRAHIHTYSDIYIIHQRQAAAAPFLVNYFGRFGSFRRPINKPFATKIYDVQSKFIQIALVFFLRYRFV